MSWMMVSAAGFVFLALIHSVLGERLLLRPLFRSQAFVGLPLGAGFSGRTFRFAWHLTSLSWIAVGALLLWPAALPSIVALLALGSGAAVALASRGQHLAWPVFLLIAVALLRSSGPLPSVATAMLSVVLSAALVGIALLHLYWASGGRWAIGPVLPEVDGRPLFTPGPAITVLVSLGALGFAAIAAQAGGWIALPLSPGLVRGGAALVALVFLARTFGDRRTVGVLKRVRGTRFARWDDRLYTPLSFGLAVGFVVLAS